MLDITSQQRAEVEMTASGRLSKSDYDRFVPRFEQIVKEEGPVRLLIYLNDFEGWDLGGMWEDLKFDTQHQNDLGKVAVVGDKKWQDWGTTLSKPFFKAEMRFFNQDQLEQARAWLREPTTTPH